jgi:transglutaminase/protease-like cytokinesis protein 3
MHGVLVRTIYKERKRDDLFSILVKIDGEYRFIDCWLASPFNPQNENKMEPHWFLTIPQDMIMTHYPQQSLFQYLDPALSPEQFFHLPYVRNPFFWYQLKVTKLSLVHEQEGIFYLCLCVPSNTSCYAETEVEGMTVRGLAQCLTDARDNRICKIKAVLPPGQTHGHLKIYAGPRISQQNEPIDKHHYPLALSLRVSTEHPETPFSFVKLFTAHNEFYIQEPQCQFLYPLQNYHFCIRNVGHRMAHHKLAVKSPGGRLYKLMYYPQDQTYDANVTVSEAGKWTLICLLHHTGGWYNVANWTCIVK